MTNRHYLKSESLQDRVGLCWALMFGILCSSVMATPDRAAAQTAPKAPIASPTEIVLVLDNSGSMKKNDPRFLTKEMVVQFIKGWPDEARGSVVIFDKHIRTISLESRDSVDLTQLNYRGLLTNIPAAVQWAIQELQLNGRSGAARSIVLLTDGVIDTGTRARDLEVTRWLRAQLASDAASTGIRIFTVALGTGSDSQMLQELAQRTGGRFFWAPQAKDLSGIFAQVSDALFAPAVLQARLKRGPQLVQLSPHTPTGDPAPSNLQQAVSPKAGREKTSTSANNAPTPEPELRADTGAPAPLVAPSQAPSALPVGLGAPGVSVVYALIFVAALLVAAILALVAMHLWYRESKRRAKSDAHTPLPLANLFDLNGVTGRERHELGALTIVGRAPATECNHIVINRPTIGRVHAVIERKHHRFWLIDQNSKNRTYVNGHVVTTPTCLSHGDQIHFHEFPFEFSLAGMVLADVTLVRDRTSLEAEDRGRSNPDPRRTQDLKIHTRAESSH
ncbi:MAG: FHA domain-containing protein [Gammaproteobacteria bacterium]